MMQRPDVGCCSIRVKVFFLNHCCFGSYYAIHSLYALVCNHNCFPEQSVSIFVCWLLWKLLDVLLRVYCVKIKQIVVVHTLVLLHYRLMESFMAFVLCIGLGLGWTLIFMRERDQWPRQESQGHDNTVMNIMNRLCQSCIINKKPFSAKMCIGLVFFPLTVKVHTHCTERRSSFRLPIIQQASF